MMKLKYILAIGCVVLILPLTGCAILNKPVQFVDKFIGATLFPPYSGQKASVVVADFDIKAARVTTEVNSGLRDMLIEGLNKTNRFLVIPTPKDYAEKNAELIIAAEVVDFDPLISGGRMGVGGGGSAASGTLGSLMGVTANKSTIVLNIRIVDALSSKVLVSERISGQAVDTGSSLKEHRGREIILNESLDAYANTSMGEAINKCITEAVKYIVGKVPAKYYKGEKNGKT
jgi:curli biogenesis system outer membrane secretion channel CsgG